MFQSVEINEMRQKLSLCSHPVSILPVVGPEIAFGAGVELVEKGGWVAIEDDLCGAGVPQRVQQADGVVSGNRRTGGRGGWFGG
jgi:hypothetical protein